MAKITYSNIRNEDSGDGSLYQLTATLEGDIFYDDAELDFDGVSAYLKVQEDPAEAIIYFYGDADAIEALGNPFLPAEVFDSGELPDGNGEGGTGGSTGEAPEAPVIDTIAEDDIIDAAEKEEGVTITGTAEVGSTVTLTFVLPTEEGVDLTELETAVEEANTTLDEAQVALDEAQAALDEADETTSEDAQAALDEAQTALEEAQTAADEAAATLEEAQAATAEGTTLVSDPIEVDEEGTWSYEVPAEILDVLVDGEYVVSAIATDEAGNESEATETTVTVDLAPIDEEAPEVAISEATFDAENGLVVTGTTEAGATVQLTIGEETFDVEVDEEGNWTHTVATEDLVDGDLVISAVATDEAGNASEATEETVSVVIDNEAPEAPVINTVAEDDIIDATEKEAGVTITGTAEAGSTVTLTISRNGSETVVDSNAEEIVDEEVVDEEIVDEEVVDEEIVDEEVVDEEMVDEEVVAVSEEPIVVEVTVDEEGNWSYELPEELLAADGEFTVSAVATDAAGNESEAAESTVTVDLTPAGFAETDANDGSVEGDVVYNLPEGETFWEELAGENLNGYAGIEVVKGVPAGMTASLVVNDDLTSATLKLEGQAIDHAQADSGELTISFDADLATYFDSQTVPADWSCAVSFNDTSSITVTENTLKESAANDGSVTGSIVFALNQAEFNSELDAVAILSDVPAGLEANFEVSEDGKTATLTFSGNADEHDVDLTFNVGFTADDFVDGNAPVDGLDETGSQFNIDFVAPKLVLSDDSQDGLNFDQGWEGTEGDNTVSTVLTLEDATFIRTDLDLTKFVSSVPAGVTAELKTISATEAELTFTVEDGVAFDPADVQITLPKVVFTGRVAVDASATSIALTNNDETAPVAPTLSLEVGDGNTAITDEERAEGVTIAGKGEAGSTITLRFGTAAGAEIVTNSAEEIMLISAFDPAELAALEEELAFAEENLTTAQADLDALIEQNALDIADAENEELNGVGEAKSWLETTKADLEAAKADTNNTAEDLVSYEESVTTAEADLLAAEEQAAATLAELQDSTLNGIADAEQLVAEAQQAVADAQAAIDTLVSGGEEPVDPELPVDPEEPTDPEVPVDPEVPAETTDAEIADELSTATVTVDANGDWTYTLTDADLIDGYGEQLIEAVATDAAGNASDAVTVAITLEDTTPPELTADVVSKYDFATKQVNVSLTGTAEIGSEVVITFSDDSTAQPTVDEKGNWTYDFTEENYLLADQGNVNLSIVATDAAGNASEPAEYEVSVPDNIDPLAPVFEAVTVLSAGDVLKGTVDVAKETDGVEVYLTFVDQNGEEVVTKKAVVDTEGNWTYNVKARDLIDDNGGRVATITAVATDAAGNDSVVSAEFAVPLPMANVAITGIDAGTDGYVSNVELEGEGDVTISGTADPDAVITLTFADGATLEGITADENGNWEEIIPASNLTAESLASITATAVVDGKQDATTAPFTEAQVDFDAPEVPVFVAEPALVGSNLEFSATVATAADGDEAARVAVSLDGGDFVDATLANGTWTYSQPAPAQGEVDVVVAAFDKAGNRTETASVNLVLDTTAPAGAFTLAPTVEDALKLVSKTEEAAGVKVTIPFDGVTAEAGGVAQLFLGTEKVAESRVLTADDITAGKIDVVIATGKLGTDGDKALTAKLTDAAGNATPESAALTITVDTVIAVAADATPAVAGDAAGVLSVTGYAENVTPVFSSNGVVLADNKLVSGETYLPGSVTAVVSDDAGNTVEITNAVELISDRTPPAVPTFTFGGKDNVATDTVVSTTKTVTVALAADVARWEYTVDGTNANATYVAGTGTSFDLTPDVYGAGKIKVRAYDAANNMSEGSNAAQFEAEVSVSAAGTFDAAGAEVGFQVVLGDYTYNIANFGDDDAIDFPAITTATVKNANLTDGAVDLQYAANGQVTLVHLTGLTAAQDQALYSVAQFNKVFGDNTITNFGTGVAGTPTTPTTPTEPTTPTTPTAKAPEVNVAVSGAGTTDLAAKATQLDFGSGNYNATVTGFGVDDVLNFPDDVKATVKNSNFTDGNVDVQWAANGQVVAVTLTGLTPAQDASLYSTNAFNNVFGAGSII